MQYSLQKCTKHQIYPSNLITYGALAQLVEQRTFNPFVVGSIPARPTKFSSKIKGLRENVAHFFVQKLLTHRLHTLAIYSIPLFHLHT